MKKRTVAISFKPTQICIAHLDGRTRARVYHPTEESWLRLHRLGLGWKMPGGNNVLVWKEN